jgi:hypothetical protein
LEKRSQSEGEGESESKNKVKVRVKVRRKRVRSAFFINCGGGCEQLAVLLLLLQARLA